ncbi:hypothetical protein IE81DRAFT_348868 [Ceraceosorus guamensis]|uniref:Uncharacterized protein n=1 Tax=Ceraceosorus guamensis TaxID=1522189 RepID=A0A316VTM7_9BASI|nr:hypothetical protein IE81DRAFT_348868 [Ceraceosorus guamensis]PWN40852.1 hypothetical protein IE81DRAFT_348868 [Ceraceosorus guamensis]
MDLISEDWVQDHVQEFKSIQMDASWSPDAVKVLVDEVQQGFHLQKAELLEQFDHLQAQVEASKAMAISQEKRVLQQDKEELKVVNDAKKEADQALTTLQDERAREAKALTQACKQIDLKVEKVSTLNADKERLQQELSASKAREEQLVANKQAQESHVERVHTSVEALQKQVNTLQREKAEAQRQGEDAAGQAQDKDQEILRLQERATKLSEEHRRKLKDMNDNIERDMDNGAKRLEGKMSRLQGELNAQKAEFDQQTRELDAMREDMLNLKGVHAGKERQSKPAHNAELGALDDENRLLQQAVGRKEPAIAKLEVAAANKETQHKHNLTLQMSGNEGTQGRLEAAQRQISLKWKQRRRLLPCKQKMSATVGWMRTSRGEMEAWRATEQQLQQWVSIKDNCIQHLEGEAAQSNERVQRLEGKAMQSKDSKTQWEQQTEEAALQIKGPQAG